MDPEQIQTFMSITGATESSARDKLQAHGGNLNAAIDSFFHDGENHNPPVQSQDTGRQDWMDEDEPPPTNFAPPMYPNMVPPIHPVPSAPAWDSGLGLHGIGFAPRFPQRGAPVVSQPRDVREVPVEWKDEEPIVRSRGGVVIEEIPDTMNPELPTQNQSHFVTDVDEVGVPTMFRAGGERPPYDVGNTGISAPSISEVPAAANEEGDDIEEAMLRAAIEASQKDARGFGEGVSGMHTDDDLARAVSLSLKTAEREKALREGKGHSWLDDDIEEPYMKGSTSKGNYSGDAGTSEDNPLPVSSAVNRISTNPVEETDDSDEQPLLRRRSGRRLSPAVTTTPELPTNVIQPSAPLETNGDVTHDEWGGLSSLEHDEAVMLEAAMFGSLPEDSSLRFRYPSVVGGVEDADGDAGGNLNYRRPAPQPPSPTVIAQRLLREQQDDEYLASLQADREKELRAQAAADEEERLRQEEERLRQEEEQRKQEEERLKQLAEEELERQLAAKRAALPQEPSKDDDSAVNLMVRMPDGSRKCRRFRKSELLQCLFDFIDVSGGVLPGSYRLVRQYPRKAFTDAEHGSSFDQLGLNNRSETLFLELI